MDYEEMTRTVVPPLVYNSIEDLMMLLSHGILVNKGKTWFWLNKNGEHCEMISAAECLTPINSLSSIFAKKSRFAVDYYKGADFCYEFKIHVRTQFLSPRITYTVNLVFDFYNKTKDYLGISYILAGETKSSTSYLVDEREDGWLMAELYHFTSNRRHVDLEISFRSENPLVVEGIDFQPVEIMEHPVVDDEDVDMQTDTYWEQKLPVYYEDIIKLSNDSVQWTTKKELYSILCKGFPFNNGEEWFSLAKNGKKCHMLPAKVALQKKEWRWRSLPNSRFGELAFDPHRSFWIDCRSTILSPQTKYAIYLVYKLQENNSQFEPPVKVSDGVFYESPYEKDHSWYIYLLCPQTPVIRRRVHQNTHNPLSRPKIKCLPQQRDDGWMEVQIWEFQTGTNTESISKDLRLTLSDNKSLNGLIVLGIEFKPI